MSIKAGRADHAEGGLIMPLFFREEKEISIEKTCTESENGHLPAVVPAKDLVDAVAAKPEQTSMPDSLEEVPDAPPEVVRSRKTKPFNWVLGGSTVLVLLPLVLLLFRITTDAFTRDFVWARLHSIMNDNSGAIAYYSRALQEKQDRTTLEARADCYEAIGDLANERADLLSLTNSADLNKLPHNWSVYSPYSRLATLDARVGDIADAVRVYQLYATFPDERKADQSSSYEQQAAYELLLLGDISKSKGLLAAIVNQDRAEKPDVISHTLGLEDGGYRQVLQALIYREDGDEARALDMIRSIGDKYVPAFRDSRFRYDSQNEVVPGSLEALIYLDNRNTGQARPLIKLAESEVKAKDNSEPIVDILKGWLLLEEGRLDDCLKTTATTLASEKELDQSIDGLNLKAALHLIRKNVFLQQNLPAQASQEDELYKQTHVSGRIFTPICFRATP